MSHSSNYYGLFFQGGDPLAMVESELQYPGMLGVVAPTKCRDGVDRDLQIVQADSILGTALTAAQVVWWKDRSANLVTNDPTGIRGQVAGVVGENVDGDIPVSSYIAIVKKAATHGVKLKDSPASAADITGKFVIPDTAAGRADVLAAGTAASYPPIGRAIGTQDATTKIAQCAVDVFASYY